MLGVGDRAYTVKGRQAEVSEGAENNAKNYFRTKNKVRVGIEPTNKSFADSRLTTWPPHRHDYLNYINIIAKYVHFGRKRLFIVEEIKK